MIVLCLLLWFTCTVMPLSIYVIGVIFFYFMWWSTHIYHLWRIMNGSLFTWVPCWLGLVVHKWGSLNYCCCHLFLAFQTPGWLTSLPHWIFLLNRASILCGWLTSLPHWYFLLNRAYILLMFWLITLCSRRLSRILKLFLWCSHVCIFYRRTWLLSNLLIYHALVPALLSVASRSWLTLISEHFGVVAVVSHIHFPVTLIEFISEFIVDLVVSSLS